ncbi:hypothetical protein HPA99_05530 [Streptococcus suis]|nr:hypothetical protein [Streptococcus suis]
MGKKFEFILRIVLFGVGVFVVRNTLTSLWPFTFINVMFWLYTGILFARLFFPDFYARYRSHLHLLPILYFVYSIWWIMELTTDYAFQGTIVIFILLVLWYRKSTFREKEQALKDEKERAKRMEQRKTEEALAVRHAFQEGIIVRDGFYNPQLDDLEAFAKQTIMKFTIDTAENPDKTVITYRRSNRWLHEFDIDDMPYDHIKIYHDGEVHQVLARFRKQSAKRFKRDKELGLGDYHRRSLRPWIRPVDAGQYDRTHIIPIGYHGFEADPRLVIGWSSEQNRNQFPEWEKLLASINQVEDIIWYTEIRKTKYGAKWTYVLTDKNGRALQRGEFVMGTEEKPVTFEWGTYEQ